MLSDILFERVKPPEDPGFANIRERVETIMETLQNQKQVFESAYQRKLTHYEDEMIRKDTVIKELSQQLQQTRTSCERASREVELYKAMIHDLRQEFHRMEVAVGQTSPKREEGLKRVKSDYIFRESNKNHEIQAGIKRNKMLHDNISTASKTIRRGIVKSRQSKQFQFGYNTMTTQKQTKSSFWPHSNASKKENRVKIKDFKENQWQQTF